MGPQQALGMRQTAVQRCGAPLQRAAAPRLPSAHACAALRRRAQWRVAAAAGDASSELSSSTSEAAQQVTAAGPAAGSGGGVAAASTSGSGGGRTADILLKALASEAGSHDSSGAAAAQQAAGKAGGSGGGGGGGNVAGALAALAGVAGGLCLILGGGYLLREPIRHFLNFFITAVDQWGVWGYVSYILVYAGLEVLALPAIPLTMTAGAIFGVGAGTVVVTIAATLAATTAFLISRYLARDRIMAFARGNKRFAAIDRAIAKDGLKFVTLLRLSPLLPLALSNYMYGLTSVDLGSYILGSCIGMLPGTYVYITAGHVGKSLLMEGASEGALQVAPWQVAAGVGATLAAVTFIGQMAKRAIEEADAEAATGGDGGSGGGGGGAGAAGAQPQAA